ncbi:MAG: DUF134 domain-containing protein [Desulfobacteraceae bacterium]|nr:MAG: DUF134 domain-containing protein [Desulfobacteraceae bacterium]
MGMDQESAAVMMNVSRRPFGRMLAEARALVADALVNGKVLRIEGGTFEMPTRRRHRRGTCRGCYGKGGGCYALIRWKRTNGSRSYDRRRKLRTYPSKSLKAYPKTRDQRKSLSKKTSTSVILFISLSFVINVGILLRIARAA